MSYRALYRQSLDDPEKFWALAAEKISWSKPWDQICDVSNPPFARWFAGAELNTCHNALDRHVENGRADQPALIFHSAVTQTVRSYTYAQLRDEVAQLAGGLAERGVTKGDRVVIYMPGLPEAVMAMLACARLGAIHSVVFGGFAAHELATRIDDAQPKAILSASCGLEAARVVPYKPLLDAAIDMARHKPAFCAILQRPQAVATLIEGRDIDWSALLGAPAAPVAVKSEDPLYILYTSGTTGQPKGVLRDNGGHAVALSWTMDHFYGLAPGEVFWAASDIGWQVGHSYITYGPLLHGATAVLFEGKPVGTPDAGAFWRVIAEHGVSALFTAPTALRAIRREDPEGLLLRHYDLSSLRALFLAGERTDPETLAWAQKHLNIPVVDHWWQTETGWPIAGNPLGVEELPIKPGSTALALPGWDVRCLDDAQREVPPGTQGNIAIKLPMAPGALLSLWNADERFIRSYMTAFPGFYATGDAGFIDEDGYIFIMSRTDDVINVAGHRLSTGAIEEVLASHADVAECAVIGPADVLKGQTPVGLVVLKSGVDRAAETIEAELVQLVRDTIGPVAAFKQVSIVDRLPKTRSGKILRGTMQKLADAQEWKMPATIDDPSALDDVAAALRRLGFARQS